MKKRSALSAFCKQAHAACKFALRSNRVIEMFVAYYNMLIAKGCYSKQ